MNISRRNFLHSHKYQLLIIIAIALFLRLGVALYLGNQIVEMPGTTDQISYHTLAIRLKDGFGFSFGSFWWPITQPDAPTAHWSFLYTYFIAAIYRIFGENPILARIVQVVIVSILHPYLAYLIGKKVFNHATGLLSAGLTAIYIYFIYYSATLMTEPLYIISVLASLYLSILLVEAFKDRGQQFRRTFIIASSLGLMLGIAVLLRQLFLLFIPFLFSWILFSNQKQSKKLMLPQVSLAALIVVLMILPFTIYNYTRFDRFVLLNTNAGFALYMANHPIHGTNFIEASERLNYGELIPMELRHLNEAALDQALLKLGLHYIYENPSRYLLLSLNRITDYFNFLPSPKSDLISNISRVGSFGIMLPFMIIGIWLGVRDNWKNIPSKFLVLPVSLLLIFIIVYTSIHLLTWSLVRYRLPVDAVLVVFAGFALWNIYNKLLSKENFHPRQIAKDQEA